MSPSSQLILLSGSTRERIGFARDISSRCSPYSPVRPFPYGRGHRGVPMFSEEYLADRVFRGMPRDIPLVGGAGGQPSFSDGLVSSGLPVGGRIPPGGYPFAGASVHRRMGLPASSSSSCAQGSAAIAAGGFGEVRCPSLADVPFPRLSAVPVLSRFTGRPGDSAVAFPFYAGALRGRFLPQPFQVEVSPFASSFSGLPEGRRFLRIDPFKRGRSLCFFRSSRPFGKRASLGASCVPLTLTLLRWLSRFRPVLQPCVPRGTHNYTRFRICVNTFFTNFLNFFCKYP